MYDWLISRNDLLKSIERLDMKKGDIPKNHIQAYYKGRSDMLSLISMQPYAFNMVLKQLKKKSKTCFRRFKNNNSSYTYSKSFKAVKLKDVISIIEQGGLFDND